MLSECGVQLVKRLVKDVTTLFLQILVTNTVKLFTRSAWLLSKPRWVDATTSTAGLSLVIFLSRNAYKWSVWPRNELPTEKTKAISYEPKQSSCFSVKRYFSRHHVTNKVECAWYIKLHNLSKLGNFARLCSITIQFSRQCNSKIVQTWLPYITRGFGESLF